MPAEKSSGRQSAATPQCPIAFVRIGRRNPVADGPISVGARLP